jgi:DNA-directed RNA polymerase specialized sigma24 family protein
MIIKIREGSKRFENDFFRKYISKKVALKNIDSPTRDAIYCETIAEVIIRIKDESKNDIKDLGGYVNICLRNAGAKYHKDQKKSPIEFHGMDEDWRWADSTLNDQESEKQLIFAMMDEVLKKLSDKCKSILEDRYLNGYTYDKIREKYNKSTENAAKWYGNDCLRKAREKGRIIYLNHVSNE